MRAKEFFLRAKEAERDISRLEAVLEHWQEYSAVHGAGLSHTPIRSGFNGSRVESAAVGTVDAREGLQAKIEAYQKIIMDAELVISQIESLRYRELLTLHYLADKPLSEIAERYGYSSETSIYRAHGWALAKAQRIIDRMPECQMHESDGGRGNG